MSAEPAVRVEEIAPGIVEIVMQDRTHKNQFSKDLVAGIQRAFAGIRADTACRAVILTGYDSYFCAGGTQDGLLALQSGRGKFTDMDIYTLPLECEVPVIAAMQGHAIGGGFVFGLFADLIVLSRESVYTTNFMRYGFTPGIGSTFIVPRKLGPALASEMLLAARNYRGAELEKRGIPFSVLPRTDVLAHARELARDLAEKPRVSLIELKRRLVSELKSELPAAIAAELRMHETTLPLPEVRELIHSEFGK